ncbi:nucleotide exchange factor GrpE [Candidatus Uhrbacteria bacterium]|nr:nucleotide exchange factor GrpE [Candidatus Uhrbacteria bacterium]
MSEEQKKQEVDKVDEVAEVVTETRCEKCDEYLAGWKRALADYDNLKKDLAKERTAIREGTKELLAYDLIQTVEHFDQALKHKPVDLSPETGKWLEGILHVRQNFESVLKDLGLEPFGEIGELFDSACCEAIGEKNDISAPDDSILEVAHRGWRLGDRVVRPAKVIVNNLQPTT